MVWLRAISSPWYTPGVPVALQWELLWWIWLAFASTLPTVGMTLPQSWMSLWDLKVVGLQFTQCWVGSFSPHEQATMLETDQH